LGERTIPYFRPESVCLPLSAAPILLYPATHSTPPASAGPSVRLPGEATPPCPFLSFLSHLRASVLVVVSRAARPSTFASNGGGDPTRRMPLTPTPRELTSQPPNPICCTCDPPCESPLCPATHHSFIWVRQSHPPKRKPNLARWRPVLLRRAHPGNRLSPFMLPTCWSLGLFTCSSRVSSARDAQSSPRIS